MSNESPKILDRSREIMEGFMTIHDVAKGKSLLFWDIRGPLEMVNEDSNEWIKTSSVIEFRGHTYNLIMIHRDKQLSLVMINLSKGIPDMDRFRKLTAFLEGQEMELKESTNMWGPVVWNSDFSPPIKSDYFKWGWYSDELPRCPSFYIMMEYGIVKGTVEGPVLSKLLGTEFMSDVQFVVKGRQFAAHSAITSSASPVLAAMIGFAKCPDGRCKTIEISDTTPHVFEQILHYLYESVIPKSYECALSLFLAAEKLQIDSLKEDCEEQLSRHVTVDNVIHLLVLSGKISAPTLLESSLDYLARHREQVWSRPEWKDLFNNDPDVFLLANQRMCEQRKLEMQLEAVTTERMFRCELPFC